MHPATETVVSLVEMRNGSEWLEPPNHSLTALNCLINLPVQKIKDLIENEETVGGTSRSVESFPGRYTFRISPTWYRQALSPRGFHRGTRFSTSRHDAPLAQSHTPRVADPGLKD